MFKMSVPKQDKDMPKYFMYYLMLIPVFMFGVLGGFIGFINDNSSAFSGFLWGIGIGIAVCAAIAVGMFGWEWIKKEANKGKLLPFILVGIAVAIAISGYLAINLGKPSCIESDTDNRGSTCIEYADNGYETTSDQKWNKFWSTLPVTVIIASLVAVIVRNEMEKNKKK
jgi:hypothetical protein